MRLKVFFLFALLFVSVFSFSGCSGSTDPEVNGDSSSDAVMTPEEEENEDEFTQ